MGENITSDSFLDRAYPSSAGSPLGKWSNSIRKDIRENERTTSGFKSRRLHHSLNCFSSTYWEWLKEMDQFCMGGPREIEALSNSCELWGDSSLGLL